MAEEKFIEITDWPDFLPAAKNESEYKRGWRPNWIKLPTTILDDEPFYSLSDAELGTYVRTLLAHGRAPLREDTEARHGARALRVNGVAKYAQGIDRHRTRRIKRLVSKGLLRVQALGERSLAPRSDLTRSDPTRPELNGSEPLDPATQELLDDILSAER
jgi:hypothetical protein